MQLERRLIAQLKTATSALPMLRSNVSGQSSQPIKRRRSYHFHLSCIAGKLWEKPYAPFHPTLHLLLILSPTAAGYGVARARDGNSA